MAEINPDFVKTGFWINWSQGRTLGATITVTSTSGNVVVALLAVLVSLAVDHLWNLVLFILHQCRAGQTTDNEVFQQQQVTLRSLPTPFLLLTDMTKISWAWRKTKRSTHSLQTLIVVSLVLMFGAAGIVASVFSSYVVKTSNIPVLAFNDLCVASIDRFAFFTSPSDWLPNMLNAAESYVDRCYNTPNTSLGCNIYVQPSISPSYVNITCPFEPSTLCIGSEPASVLFDSGLLDSNAVLGINDSPGNRVFFRRQATYTPIEVENHYTMLNSNQIIPYIRDPDRKPLPGEEMFRFDYGDLWGLGGTVFVSSYLSNLSSDYGLAAAVNYSNLHLYNALAHKWLDFDIIPELYHPTADTAVLFVFSQDVVSLVPIDDPVFAAHRLPNCTQPESTNCNNPDRNWFWRADQPAGVIAAVQQYQACIADDSGNPSECTELTGTMGGNIHELLPRANEAQRTVLTFLDLFMSCLRLDILDQRKILKADSTLDAGAQFSGLPVDQWVREALNWESILLALLQIAVGSHSTGFGGVIPLAGPSSPAETRMCESQKILRPGGFANISVLGLSLVLGVSIFLMIIDIFLLKILVSIEKTRKLFGPHIHHWIQDGALQLQRKVYEAEDIGPWIGSDNEVPILSASQGQPTSFVSHGGGHAGTSSYMHTSKFNAGEYSNLAAGSLHQSRNRSHKQASSTIGSSSFGLRFTNTIDEKTQENEASQLSDYRSTTPSAETNISTSPDVVYGTTFTNEFSSKF